MPTSSARSSSGKAADPPRALGLAALLLLTIAAASIYWIWPALPFQDLPGHAGLIALRARIATSAFDQSYFVHVPRLGPYSVFRALGALFFRVHGPLFAVRLLGTLPVLALPSAMLFARKLIFGRVDPAHGFFALTLSFGYMTISGFASYNLAIAVALIAVAVHVAFLAPSSKRRARSLGMAIAALSVALYFCHGFAFGLACVAVFGASLVPGVPLAKRASSLVLWFPGALVAVGASYVERRLPLPAGAMQPAVPTVAYYDGFLGKLSLLLTPTLMTRTGVDVAIGVVLWLSVGFVTFRARVKLGLATRRLLAATALLFCVFCILPHGIGWFGFVDGRVAPFLLLLPLLALEDSAWPRWFLRALAPGLALSMVLLLHVCASMFQAEARGAKDVLDAVPARARLLSLMVNPDSKVFTGSPFTHYDKLVLAERECVPSAMWFHQGSALYPTPQNPVLRLPSSYHEADIGHIDWTSFRLEDWDYVFLRTSTPAPLPDASPRLTLAAHGGTFWLYRVQNMPGPPPARTGPDRPLDGQKE